jgi:hypothetical protein
MPLVIVSFFPFVISQLLSVHRRFIDVHALFCSASSRAAISDRAGSRLHPQRQQRRSRPRLQTAAASTTRRQRPAAVARLLFHSRRRVPPAARAAPAMQRRISEAPTRQVAMA